MRRLSLPLLASALFLFTSLSHAAGLAEGPRSGGGGDICEDRIQAVRDDIKNWIGKGGPKGLSLPSGLSADQYSQAMLEQMKIAKVACAGKGDPGFPVEIQGTPKICVFSKSNDSSRVTCDFAKFLALNQSDQYVLIHHEYAGLAGLETPIGDISTYAISNQISAYLQNEVVKRLSVVAKPSSAPNNIESNFGAFIGQYQVVQCSYRSPKAPDGSNVCDNLQDAILAFAGSGKDLALNLDLSMNKTKVPFDVTIAWNQADSNQSCTTFPGKQYCEGINESGPFSVNTEIKTSDGLTYLTFDFSSNDGGFDFQDLSLALKRK